MKEIKGNIWDIAKGAIVSITTNGDVNRSGACVMGRGVAYQAAKKWPKLPFIIGELLLRGGNQPYFIDIDGYEKLITFPVKHHWNQKADINLIRETAEKLSSLLLNTEFNVYIPRPGCGNGGLIWLDVAPILSSILDDRFWIVSL